MKNSYTNMLFIFCIFAILFLSAKFFPITQDEAYYLAWSKFLDWGYFDHPPGVAFISWLSTFFGETYLNGRVGTILCVILSILCNSKLFQLCGITDRRTLLLTLILAHLNLGGIAVGLITTPDSLLMLSWSASLLCLALAIDRNTVFWIPAGFVLGIGLCAKYTMVLMGIIYFLYWIRNLHILKTRWPYLCIISASVVFIPHIMWNAQNDWISIKFQLRHGFNFQQEKINFSNLPIPVLMPEDGKEYDIAKNFITNRNQRIVEKKINEVRENENKIISSSEAEDIILEESKPPSHIYRIFNRTLSFLASQLAFWGWMLIAILAGLIVYFRKKTKVDFTLNVKLTPIIKLATFLPLIFFGLISLWSKIEANWPAMYVISASPILIQYVKRFSKLLIFGSIINLLMFGALITHTLFPFLPIHRNNDRLKKETYFLPLSEFVNQLDGPIFADSYQLVSMLRFYNPTQKIDQYPYITRSSEFTRRKDFINFDYDYLKFTGFFWMITTDIIPPRIPNFHPSSLIEARNCENNILHVQFWSEKTYKEVCPSPHTWYIAKYELL